MIEIAFRCFINIFSSNKLHLNIKTSIIFYCWLKSFILNNPCSFIEYFKFDKMFCQSSLNQALPVTIAQIESKFEAGHMMYLLNSIGYTLHNSHSWTIADICFNLTYFQVDFYNWLNDVSSNKFQHCQAFFTTVQFTYCILKKTCLE